MPTIKVDIRENYPWWCRNCGEAMVLRQGGTIYRCRTCGSTVPVPVSPPARKGWFRRCLNKILRRSTT
jgi:ribosomal protein L37AE/L43A